MKILQIIPALHSGGIETGTIDLSRVLKKLGHEVIVVSSGGAMVSQLDSLGVEHINLPVNKKSARIFFVISKLARIIRQRNVELVHASSRVPAWIAYFACRITGVPFVTSCHGFYSRHFFSSVMGWGKFTIVISKIIKDRMIKEFNVDKNRVRLVYRGVDLDNYNFNETKYDRKMGAFKIVNIGRITPLKGHIEFIEAIKRISERNKNIVVFIIGHTESRRKKYLARLKDLTKKLGMQHTINFLGAQSNINGILDEADLLVLSTNVPEAFGRVIVEAGAIGTAVCASRIGGIPEIIEDGKSGLLFSAGDIEDMAEKINIMIEDLNFRRNCAANLRKRVKENFTLDKMAIETLAVYKEAVEIKNILVVKPASLGDLILVVPSLRCLRKNFPNARISLLIEKKFRSFMQDCPYVDEIIVFERSGFFSSITGFFVLTRKIRDKNFDISIDFKNSNWSHLVPFLSGISRRFGYKKGLLRFMINWGGDLTKEALSPVKHQFRILKLLGIDSNDESLELWEKKDINGKFNKILKEKNVSDSDIVIGFVIGASPRWKSKQWKDEYFRELASRLLRIRNIKIILLGAPHDVALSRSIFIGENNNIINLVGMTSLEELVGLIRRLDCLFTPDSAPLHISAAVNTKSVVLFGPTSSSRHMPPEVNSIILEKKLSCQPCYSARCRNKEENACLAQISVEEVHSAIMQQIQDREDED